MRAFGSLTAVVEGRRVILDDPPTIQHGALDLEQGAIQKFFTDYRATLSENRREFLERFRFVDAAIKVVGVGSVGTRCWILVLEGRDENDPLILQFQGGNRLRDGAAFRRRAVTPTMAERVVVGQRLMQATPDILLGWTRGPGGRDFYFRQLWDMKGSVDTSTLQAPGPGVLRGAVRLGARPGPLPQRRRGRDRRLSRDERCVRRCGRGLRGDLRRPPTRATTRRT